MYGANQHPLLRWCWFFTCCGRSPFELVGVRLRCALAESFRQTNVGGVHSSLAEGAEVCLDLVLPFVSLLLTRYNLASRLRGCISRGPSASLPRTMVYTTCRAPAFVLRITPGADMSSSTPHSQHLPENWRPLAVQRVGPRQLLVFWAVPSSLHHQPPPRCGFGESRRDGACHSLE